jgi:hypothetical protein
MRYRLCSLVASGLIFCGVPGLVCAATIDCAPLRPGSQVDSTVEDTIKGQANILLRSLGSGSVENGYRQVESDTLARYPSADKLLLWREYIYVSCTLLAASSHWSDDEKWDKWMRLMNRWSAAPSTDTASAPAVPSPPQPSAETPSAAAAPVPTQPVIGGVGLGTSLAQIQVRKDISLSLDSDGTLYGEETFTFTYGLRQLDGDVVFGLRGDAVYSITVTHTLGSTRCADSATAAMILDDQIHDWGAPLRHVVPGDGTGGETTSYSFSRNGIDMVLVLQTSSRANSASLCRVSLNYQRSAAHG